MPKNLALHKAVTQSSTYAQKLPASLAVDGDPRTCTQTMKQEQPFWGVYLPGGRHIEHVSIILNLALYKGFRGWYSSFT